jgi:hypothetical protein
MRWTAEFGRDHYSHDCTEDGVTWSCVELDCAACKYIINNCFRHTTTMTHAHC